MTEPGQYSTNVSDMYAVHKALLDALDEAPALVARAGDDPQRVGVISSFYENVLEFLHVHHMGEDELLYPKLEERNTDHSSILVRIDDQHKLLYEPMDAARSALATWKSTNAIADGQSVVASLTTVDATLRPHLAEEEETVLPIAAKWLSQEEWSELPAHGMMAFQQDKPWLCIGLIREELTPEQSAEMIGSMPPPVQDMWHNEWEPAFTNFMAQVRA